jgi:hypothetical protein
MFFNLVLFFAIHFDDFVVRVSTDNESDFEYFRTSASDRDGEMVPNSQGSAGHTGELEAGELTLSGKRFVFLRFFLVLIYVTFENISLFSQ